MNEDRNSLELGLIPTHRKTGDESFSANGKETGATLLGFWQWAVSDLLDNTERGILAEYLVALDLGVASGVRSGWDAFDLTTESGIRVEVKSASYIVFCLLAHKDQSTVDPMNIDQWRFFIVPTAELDTAIPDQKTIGLSGLQAMGAREVDWGRIGSTIDELAETSGRR